MLLTITKREREIKKLVDIQQSITLKVFVINN